MNKSVKILCTCLTTFALATTMLGCHKATVPSVTASDVTAPDNNVAANPTSATNNAAQKPTGEVSTVVSASQASTDQSGTTTCEHDYGEGNVITPATCLTDGVVEYTCTKCNEVKSDVLPAGEHNYVDYRCSACQLVDPDNRYEFLKHWLAENAPKDEYSNLPSYQLYQDDFESFHFGVSNDNKLILTGDINYYMFHNEWIDSGEYDRLTAYPESLSGGMMDFSLYGYWFSTDVDPFTVYGKINCDQLSGAAEIVPSNGSNVNFSELNQGNVQYRWVIRYLAYQGMTRLENLLEAQNFGFTLYDLGYKQGFITPLSLNSGVATWFYDDIMVDGVTYKIADYYNKPFGYISSSLLCYGIDGETLHRTWGQGCTPDAMEPLVPVNMLSYVGYLSPNGRYFLDIMNCQAEYEFTLYPIEEMWKR